MTCPLCERREDYAERNRGLARVALDEITRAHTREGHEVRECACGTLFTRLEVPATAYAGFCITCLVEWGYAE